MTYALDSSGTSVANLVTGEANPVNTQNQISDTYLFFAQGPAYEKGLILNYAPVSGTGRQLVLGVDYEPAFVMKGVAPGNDICGAVRIINKGLIGVITSTYQCLGGIWSFLTGAMLQVVSTTAIDPNVAYFGLVPSPPIVVPGTTANLSLSSATAVALAQSLNPLGVSLTIVPLELPEADQLSRISPSLVNTGGPSTGTPDMSSNYAQETGGNLAIIAAEVTQVAQGQAAATAASQSAATASTAAATAISQAATAISASSGAQGAVTDAAYGGSGSGSLVSIEKGIFAKVADMDAKMSSGMVATGAAGAALALDASVSAVNASVQQVLTAIKGTQAIAGSLWVDVTTTPAHYYVRREVYSQTLNAYVVSWENVDGTTANPTLANLSVAGASSAGAGSSNSVDQINLTYSATGNGTGYSTGDMLLHSYGLNTATTPATLSFNIWFNATTATVLTAPPTNGTFAQVGTSTVTVSSTVLAPNAAQETGGNLAAIAAAQGTTADAAYGGSGASSVIAALKGLYAKLAGTLTTTGTITSSALPTNAAQETGGHLANVDAVQGTTTDAAWSGTGASTVIAALKAVYNKLTGTLTTSATISGALPAGANNIGSINVAALPALPAGANTIGAVTGAGGAALATSADILAVTNAIKATVGITGTVWFDPTVNPPVYYVRREVVNEGTGVITVSWLNPDGSAATPSNLAKLQISGDAQNLQNQSVTYLATAAGTGYAISDILIHALAIDRSTSPATVAYNIWINVTQGTVLTAAPAAGNISQSSSSTVSVTSSVLPANAAQETGGNLASLATSNTAMSTATGAVGDAAWSGTGNGGIVAVLKGIWGRLTGVQYVIASDGVYVPVESLSQSLGYDGSGNLTTVTVQYGGHTYTQTMTYLANVLQTTSNWVMS